MAFSTQVTTSSSLALKVIARELGRQYKGQWEYANFVAEYAGAPITAEQMLAGNLPDGIGSGKQFFMMDNPFLWAGRKQKNGGVRWTKGQFQAKIGTPSQGDVSIEKTGQMADLRFQEGYVNELAFPIAVRRGIMGEQVLGSWADEIRNDAAPQLYDWSNRFAVKELRYAEVVGYSPHMVNSNSGSLSVTKRFHPEFLIPGLAKGRGASNERYTTWSNTTATFEQRLSRKIAQVSSGTEHQMSAKMLEVLAGEARRRVRPLRADNGKRVWGLELTLEQMAQLRSDVTFLRNMQFWPSGMNQQDVLFYQSDAMYAGFAIFQMVRGVACQIYASDSAAGGDTLTEMAVAGTVTSANADYVKFGPLNDDLTEKDWTSPDADDLDSYFPTSADPAAVDLNRHMGVIWGENALTGVNCPVRSPLVTQKWDADRNEDLYYMRVGGWARNDFYDHDDPASATAVRNTSSIPFVTYSPPTNSN